MGECKHEFRDWRTCVHCGRTIEAIKAAEYDGMLRTIAEQRARIAELEAEREQPTLAELHARVRDVLGAEGAYEVVECWDGEDGADCRCSWTTGGDWSAEYSLASRSACMLHILEREGEEP